MGIVKFFDKIEDKVRGTLSRFPIVYALVGGVAIVIFWRGIWHTADIIESGGGFLAPLFGAPFSTVVSVAILLMSGLFVSFFIGDRIILSGLTHEKKIEEKTESEVRQEGMMILTMYKKIEKMEGDLAAIKEELKK